MDGQMLKDKRAERDRIIERLVQSLSALESVEKDIDGLCEERQEITDSIGNLSREIKQIYEQEIQGLKGTIKEKDQIISSYEKDKTASTKKINELAAELDKANINIKGLQDERNNLDARKSQLEEDIKTDKKTIENLNKQLTGANTQFQQLKTDYEDLDREKKSLEISGNKDAKIIEDLRNNLETANKETQKWKDQREELSNKNDTLTQDLNNANQENKNMNQSLESAKDEIKKLTEELKNAKGTLTKMADLIGPLEVYQRFSEWSGNDKAVLNIQGPNFITFLLNCSQKLDIYYKNAGKIVKNPEVSQESVKMIDEVIDCGIELNRRGRGKAELRRQEVKEGDVFNGALHNKSENNPYSGVVAKVYLRGILIGDRIYDKCRAYVEVKGPEERS